MELLKKHLPSKGIFSVKIKKKFPPKDGQWGQTMGAYVEWQGKEYSEYFKQKDFGLVEEGVTLMAKLESYQGKPYIQWEAQGDITVQPQNTKEEIDPVVKEPTPPTPTKEFYNETSPTKREVSIVAQGFMKCKWFENETKDDNVDEMMKKALNFAKEFLNKC